MYSHYYSSILTTLLSLLCLCTIPFSSVSAQQKKINLTPHEQRLFDAVDNVNNDFNAFKACFASSALIEQHFNDVKNGKTVEKSGTFDDTLGNFKSMKEYKIKWEPVTTTDANHPDLGMFAFKYWNYGLTEEGCEGFFSGLGIAQFDEDGLITVLKGYSSDFLDFVNCMENGSNVATAEINVRSFWKDLISYSIFDYGGM